MLFRSKKKMNYQKKKEVPKEKDELQSLETLTAQTLEQELRAKLPDPANITSLSQARETINKLNNLVIGARQDVLSVAKNMKVTLDLLEKEREITKGMAIKMFVNTKDTLYGVVGMFSSGMQTMTFSMTQLISDNNAVQKLLIPLVRTFTKHKFGCSEGKVYMCLQPSEGFLGEWEYGLNMVVSK